MDTKTIDGKTFKVTHCEGGTLILEPVPPEHELKTGDVFNGPKSLSIYDGYYIDRPWVIHHKEGSFAARHDAKCDEAESFAFNIFDVLDGTYAERTVEEFRQKVIDALSFEDKSGDSGAHSLMLDAKHEVYGGKRTARALAELGIL